MKTIGRMVSLGMILMLVGCCRPGQTSFIRNEFKSNAMHTNEHFVWLQQVASYFDIALNEAETSAMLKKYSSMRPDENELVNTFDATQFGSALNEIGLEFDKDSNALNWEKIKQQIACREKPVIYLSGQQEIEVDAIMIVGYTEIGAARYLIVMDSNEFSDCKERWITYEEYKDPEGLDKHLETWYNISTN